MIATTNSFGLKLAKSVENDALWEQMLYVGDVDQGMTPEAVKDTCASGHLCAINEPQPIFHLPSFLLDPNFTGDVYLPGGDDHEPQTSDHPSASPPVHASYAFAPPWYGYRQRQFPDLRVERPLKASEIAPPWPHYNDPKYNAPAPPPSEKLLLAPPWPHYNQPALHALPPSPSPASSPHLTSSLSARRPSLRPRVFHAPTQEEIETIVELRKLRALEEEIDAEQKIRDAADGRHSDPAPTPPRVFVPPSPAPNRLQSSHSPCRAVSLSRARSPTPFRFLLPLPARFPSLFAVSSDGDDTCVPSDSETEPETEEQDVFWAKWDAKEFV
ncbi:hypothetical protein C8R44DRAFT_884999 [Mycena epipterygia]|nr:hypothetical protein C8R44DRAFT_884999 [Mycena epipterygia]